MKCPKCQENSIDEELKANINERQAQSPLDYVEVELACINNHRYFTRIKEDDLIED